MSGINKKQLYTMAKADPALAFVYMAEEMQRGVEEKIQKEVEKKVGAAEKSFGQKYKQLEVEYKQKLSDAQRSFPRAITKITEDLHKQLRSKIDSIRYLKGDPGQPGEPGKPGGPGESAKNLVEGVDYPSKEQIGAMIADQVYKLFSRADAASKKDVDSMVEKLRGALDLDPKKIARSLETLKGTSDALDYESLKNKPGIKMYDEKGGKSGGLLRGGTGSQSVSYADLTDQCDGVLKTFTIPANKRVLGVFSTQFPINYRPLVDWTSTTHQLTLTGEVGAPEAGQTLYIMYVAI